MNGFLELLKFISYGFLAITVGFLAITVSVIIICWLAASMNTLHYTKQNNVLLRELCVKNGLNVDSLINTTQNDTLNLKIDIKGE